MKLWNCGTNTHFLGIIVNGPHPTETHSNKRSPVFNTYAALSLSNISFQVFLSLQIISQTSSSFDKFLVTELLEKLFNI